jgi:transposase InsO family protein
MYSRFSSFFRKCTDLLYQAANRRLRRWTRTDNHTLTLNAAVDLTRSKPELVLENAFLRQQLIILNRHVKRPAMTPRDRVLLVFLARKLHSWKQALIVVQPDTLLRWHRDLFRWFWKRKSRPGPIGGRPPLSKSTVALIQQMAKQNRTWGAERIRGELLKLGLRVSNTTISKYIQCLRSSRGSGQHWLTFLRNHASDIWACDFLHTYDVFFRSVFLFVIIELGSRRVVHCGVTRNPTDQWVAQQLREATPHGQGPRFLIWDNDCKYGTSFARVATGTGIEVLRTPYRAPKANAICERFLGSLRRECLDHLLILSERHLHRAAKQYKEYFNYARPHQGIEQRIPCITMHPEGSLDFGKVTSRPVLGGLHHDYGWQVPQNACYN